MGKQKLSDWIIDFDRAYVIMYIYFEWVEIQIRNLHLILDAAQHQSDIFWKGFLTDWKVLFD